MHACRSTLEDPTARDNAGNLSTITTLAATTSPAAGTQTPFKGSAFNPGQTIQVEDFDNGGEGVAYHDNDSQNRGPSTYRPGAGVDLYTGSGGLINAGYVQAGEWTEYTVNIPEAGDYNFAVRLAHVAPGAQFILHLYGNPNEWDSGAINVPNTGSWNNYTTVNVPAANLPAGQYQLRLIFHQAASNGSVGNYDWLRIDRVQNATLPAPSETPEINGADADSIHMFFNETQVPPESIWRFERQKSGTTTWVPAKILNPGESVFDDEGLERGTVYTYRFRVERGGEVSQWVQYEAGTSPFAEADIGSPSPAGYTSSAHGGSLYTIGAGGADIHGNADQFHFGHLPVSGDFDYSIVLEDIFPGSGSATPVDPWAKVGLMARESLNANSRNVAIVQSFSNGPRFQVRSTTGGWTNTSGTGLTQHENIELRLRRVGDTFIGYQRNFGSDTWVEIGRVTLGLPDTIYFGVAATSHNQGSGIGGAFFLFQSLNR